LRTIYRFRIRIYRRSNLFSATAPFAIKEHFLPSNPQDPRDKAEEKLKKAQAGIRAMAEYRAEGEARRIKSAKLRELRLAKEAADLAAAEKDPSPKKIRRKA
jgi:hypothetical protein